LPADDARRLETLLENLKLPVRIQADQHAVLDALRKDKKRQGEQIHFVLLDDIGRAVVDEIPLTDLETAINDMDI
jgi:3-dehydroquinate synthase